MSDEDDYSRETKGRGRTPLRPIDIENIARDAAKEAARNELRSLFRELGTDVSSMDSVVKLRDTLDHARDQQKNSGERKARFSGAVIASGVSTLLGAAVTIMTQWLVRKGGG